MRLSELTAATRQISVDYYGHAVAVTYLPGALTPEQDDRLQAAQKDGALTDALIDLLVRLLVAWDVMGDDDKALAIEPATLRTLPNALLLQVMTAVQEDMVPNARNGRR
jgi:hypothetical protein